jgi:hypothetical protein
MATVCHQMQSQIFSACMRFQNATLLTDKIRCACNTQNGASETTYNKRFEDCHGVEETEILYMSFRDSQVSQNTIPWANRKGTQNSGWEM